MTGFRSGSMTGFTPWAPRYHQLHDAMVQQRAVHPSQRAICCEALDEDAGACGQEQQRQGVVELSQQREHEGKHVVVQVEGKLVLTSPRKLCDEEVQPIEGPDREANPCID
eukprot:CAMPEP_0170584172 /NCGR_PEP_ID=MMETSP0224-20130122/8546_1 /TAXON_ID=285029 /ORGANISM="Togula jolla, Strain CCCM 725" /LENGTH=110 /DNA_ID=CAMNT_0010907587 /DNA_START=48 /DNA_END=381 /DNA_ORIENTATION=+